MKPELKGLVEEAWEKRKCPVVITTKVQLYFLVFSTGLLASSATILAQHFFNGWSLIKGVLFGLTGIALFIGVILQDKNIKRNNLMDYDKEKNTTTIVHTRD